MTFCDDIFAIGIAVFFYLIVNQTKGTGFVVGKGAFKWFLKSGNESFFICLHWYLLFQSGANHFWSPYDTNQRLAGSVRFGMIVDLYHSSLLSLFLVRYQKESYPRSVGLMKLVINFSIKTLKKLTVQALAPQGNEMSLVLTFAIRTVDQRVVSPLLCGSHPYPCGSLTYRISSLLYSFTYRKSTLICEKFPPNVW